jgi:hypothetical protein
MADCSPSANSSETVSSGVRSLSDDPESVDDGTVEMNGLAVGTDDPGGDMTEEMEGSREREWG